MGDAAVTDGGGTMSEGLPSGISSFSTILLPDLSSCHRCGLRFPINGSADLLKTLDSLWRIVLLCQDCIFGVRSAQVCSYCFSEFQELEGGLLDCNMCYCRVHRVCVPLQHRNFSPSQLDAVTFTCMDCCPIPNFLGKDPKESSYTSFRFSLKDLILEAKPMSEKKVASKIIPRKVAVKKAAVTRVSSEFKRKAPSAVHLVMEPSYINLSVPDEELALQLHQSMNGSQRISRSLCPKNLGLNNIQMKVRENNTSVGRVLHPKSGGPHGKIEVCTVSKSLYEDRGNSQLILTTNPSFEQENGNPMRQTRGCTKDCSGDFSLKDEEISMRQTRGCTKDCSGDFSLKDEEISLKFLESNGDGSNISSELLPNTRSNNWSCLIKDCRFGDGEGSSESQQKSLDKPSPDKFLKKYFRRRWSFGRIVFGNDR